MISLGGMCTYTESATKLVAITMVAPSDKLDFLAILPGMLGFNFIRVRQPGGLNPIILLETVK